MITRERLEALEEQALAPYAHRSRNSRGREFSEPEPKYRTAFQRDRDRILHPGPDPAPHRLSTT